jgi:hypothetical protein
MPYRRDDLRGRGHLERLQHAVPLTAGPSGERAHAVRASIETPKLESFVKERGGELTVSIQAIIQG